jgi:hypothetical protein
MTRRRIWLGIGASVLTSASTIAISGALSETTATQPPAMPAQGYSQIARAGGEGGEGGEAGSGPERGRRAGAGGEGGEGGEAGGSGLGQDEFYAFSLLIMRGHLRIGHELAEQGHWQAAYPHFLHPIPEGYEPIEADLARRGVAAFEDDLKALAQAVLKHDAKAMAADYRAVLAKIDAAVARVDVDRRASPAYVATVATRLMRKAADEYAESIENGRVAEAHEYQDARGFLLEAGDYLQQNASALRAANDAGFRELESARAEALRAMPTALPPKAPLVDPGIVSAAVTRAEFAASGIR